MRSNAEVLVTNGAGGSDLLRTANALAGRRFVAISNNAATNPIFVTIGGETPAAGVGVRVNALSTIVLELGPQADLRAISPAGAQTPAGSGTDVSEW